MLATGVSRIQSPSFSATVFLSYVYLIRLPSVDSSIDHTNFKLGRMFKTESIRKLSNFNFQWTKTLYQNNLNNIAFFFTFFKG